MKTGKKKKKQIHFMCECENQIENDCHEIVTMDFTILVYYVLTCSFCSKHIVNEYLKNN